MTWLEEIRRNKGLKQKDVAREAKIAAATYSNIENEKRGITVDTAKRIAGVLGFDWKRFFDEVRMVDEGESVSIRDSVHRSIPNGDSSGEDDNSRLTREIR